MRSQAGAWERGARGQKCKLENEGCLRFLGILIINNGQRMIGVE
jgi:hypothetical protein